MSDYHVTFRTKKRTFRRKYKKEAAAIRAIHKFLLENESYPLLMITLMSPHNPIRVFKCHTELEDLDKKEVSFYKSKRWLALRFKVLAHFGANCMCCPRGVDNGTTINVDHIYPRSKYPELEYVIENLQVLCDKCNQGKLNIEIVDFRPQIYKDKLSEKLQLLGIKIQH
ncbi:MAG TPA: hypothetical protein DG048_14820 [Pseudoalteromonas sp.]|jgi:5-methylcytosine-specific restriction endonuclease McrA|nr:hypothetical protein [Pseudoalteromonas sp.]|tara:strand:- start:1 stop:507 length:507 start_codon:yes stop_codon:yes gene_type:complete